MLSQTALLILGMHRSGTSAWAGVLSALGLQLPKRLLPANEFNRKGYFEPEAIVRAHDQYLAELGRSWSSVHPIADEDLSNRRSDAWGQELIDLVREDFDAGEPWIIKDPRICLLMPIWQRVLRELDAEPRVLVPMRKPFEVAKSLANRDGMSIDHGYFLWLRHVLDAERHTRGLRRTFVSTDALTSDWRSCLKAVDEEVQLGLKARIERDGVAADAFLDPQMIHRVTPSREEAESDIPRVRRWAEEVHDAVGKIGSAAAPDVSARLDAIRTEFDEYAHAVGAVVVDIECALQERVRQYFAERSKRTKVEADLTNARHEISVLSQKKAAEQSEAQRKEIAARAEEIAATRVEAYRQEIEEELSTERQAAVDLAEEVQSLTRETRQLSVRHDLVVTDHTRLHDLYFAEATIHEQIQLEHADLVGRYAAEVANSKRLKFETIRLSEQLAAISAASTYADRLNATLRSQLEQNASSEEGVRRQLRDFEREIAGLRREIGQQSSALAVEKEQLQALDDTAQQSLQLAETLMHEAEKAAQIAVRVPQDPEVTKKSWFRFGLGSGGSTDEPAPAVADDRLEAERRLFRAKLESLAQQYADIMKASVTAPVASDAPGKTSPEDIPASVDEAEIVDVAIPRRLVYVSHDAHPHGAQMLSLSMIAALQEHLNLEVEVVLLEGGPLLERFEELATVHVLSGRADSAEAKALADDLYARGFRGAIANTTVSGLFAKTLKRAGFRIVSLVHELAGVIRSGRYEGHARAIAENADRVLFAAPLVRNSFERFAGLDPRKVVIRPQGLYKRTATVDPIEVREHRTKLRQRLTLSPAIQIVINVGFADQRKGVDLFCDVAERVIGERNDVVFVWVGHLHEGLQDGLNALAQEERMEGRLKFMGLVDPKDVGSIYGGADLFLLTSREDPYPSVVMEAFDAGLPVVGFEGVAGTDELIRKGPGELVPAFDTEAMAEAVVQRLDSTEDRAATRDEMRALIADEFDFRRYVLDVAALADPGYRRVSVIVPSHDSRDDLEARFEAIAEQTYPIYEIIVVEDGSADGSRNWLEANLTEIAPTAKLNASDNPPRSRFVQWQRGLELAQGEYVWIVLPEDLPDPKFLETVLKGFSDPGVVLSYCQSRSEKDEDAEESADTERVVRGGTGGKWQSAYVEDGETEIWNTLALTNTIPHVGAVIAARLPLRRAVESIAPILDEMKEAGEWLLWVALLALGRIAYTPEMLNEHPEADKEGAEAEAKKDSDAVLHQMLRIQSFAQAVTRTDDETRYRAEARAWQLYQRLTENKKTLMAPIAKTRAAIDEPINIPLLSPLEPPPTESTLHKSFDVFARSRAAFHRVSPKVHEKDFIYQFITRNPTFATRREAVEYYFDDGRQSADQLRTILERREFDGLLRKPKLSMLEFASGYGAVSRHLPRVFPNCDIVPCDIHEDAVEFLRNELGLPAVLSKKVPEDLWLGRTFDIVFALSFFSHMPDRTWGRWLARLFSHVSPGGALVFTTHGGTSRQFLGYPTLDEQGYWFMADSEQKDLSSEDYGQTIVMPSYVLRKVYENASAPLAYYQQGLWWEHQDVYAFVRSGVKPADRQGSPKSSQ